MDIYIITVNNDHVYRFFSGSYDLYSDDGNGNEIIYKAAPITRKELTYDLATEKYSITAPINLPPFDTLSPSHTVIPIKVDIYRVEDNAHLYSGNVLTTKHDYKKGTVEITLQPRFLELDGYFPRKTYSTNCSFKLGDEDCGVNLEQYALILGSGDFTLDKNNIISEAFGSAPDSEYYTAGYVRANTGEAIYINKFFASENRISLMTRFYDNGLITSITVYPGCSKKLDICVNRFNNKANFGGFPYIPVKNPALQGFR